MTELKKEKIALFRFQVIAPLLGLAKGEWGKKERLLEDITNKQWDIPYTGRSAIGRSTVLAWLSAYEESGQNLRSLYPKQRSDRGTARCMDGDTEQMLIALRKELGGTSVPTLLKVAQERKLLPVDFRASRHSIYRLFKRCGFEDQVPKTDRRRFEAELPNDLWQSDCLHGPQIVAEGKHRKTFLFAFIDDHSRLIPHAQFYLRENLQSFLDCFRKALEKRGIPRKLYVDNGSSYRSHQLAHTAASLGIALIHTKPYTPEGRGKIERWMKTVRMCFLATLPEGLTLAALNERLWGWIEKSYHLAAHSATKQKPLERYLKALTLIRPSPKNLLDFFRIKAVRRVYKDRTVSVRGRVYEAPVELIEKQVTLLYHESDPSRIEVQWNGRSYGFLLPLNPTVNYRLKRTQSKSTDIAPPPNRSADGTAGDGLQYKSGKLFERREPHGEL
jgi:transposase InsO family protein